MWQNTGKPVNQAAAIAGISEGIVSGRQPLPFYISTGCSPYDTDDRELSLTKLSVHGSLLTYANLFTSAQNGFICHYLNMHFLLASIRDYSSLRFLRVDLGVDLKMAGDTLK